MLKKLLVILLAIIVSSVLIDRISVIFEDIKEIDSFSLNNALSILGFIVLIISCCLVFGFITKHVAATKGYNDGFIWGFLLGLIGLLVVGLRSNVKAENNFETQQNHLPVKLLNQLKDLHDQGILSDEEYTQKKQEILSRL